MSALSSALSTLIDIPGVYTAFTMRNKETTSPRQKQVICMAYVYLKASQTRAYLQKSRHSASSSFDSRQTLFDTSAV